MLEKWNGQGEEMCKLYFLNLPSRCKFFRKDKTQICWEQLFFLALKNNNPNKFGNNPVFNVVWQNNCNRNHMSFESCYLSSQLLFMTKYFCHDKILVS